MTEIVCKILNLLYTVQNEINEFNLIYFSSGEIEGFNLVESDR